MARLFLTNAHLIPGDGAGQSGMSIVVKGDRIEQVTDGPVDAGPDDRVVDLGGRAVMPGMVSCHHHAGYHQIGKKPLVVGFEAPPAYLALAGGQSMTSALGAALAMASRTACASASCAASPFIFQFPATSGRTDAPVIAYPS